MMLTKRPFINWKVVFISVLVIIILLAIVFVVQSYRTIVASKLVGEEKITEIIKNETDMTSIDEIVEFQEIDTIYIATGTNKEDEELLVFTKEATEETKQFVKQYEQAELWTEQDIIATWKETCEQCTFKKSQPAMMKEEPLWEITYVDEYDRYVLAYFSLEDGSIYEEMKLNRKYQ